MIRKFLSVVAVTLSLLTTGTSYAQLSRGEWNFSPVITLTNNLYGLGYGMLVSTATPYAWMPDVESRFSVPQSIHTPMGSAKVKYWDWGLRNIAAGYRVTYMSKTTPFGLSFRLAWEKRGLQATFTDKSENENPDDNNSFYKYFNRQTINPEILLRVRFGSYINSTYNPLLEIGGSYNIAVACKGLSQSTKSINNGFRGIIGFGIGNTLNHYKVTLRYEYDFYNWFNEDWSPKGSSEKPYKGWKTHLGAFMLNASYGF